MKGAEILKQDIGKNLIACFVLLLTLKTAGARQMECSYDFATALIVKTLTETDGGNTVSSRYYTTISPVGGEEMWIGKETWPTKSQIGMPYKKMWEKLYSHPDKYINEIAYIDFEKVNLHVMQAPGSYLENLA